MVNINSLERDGLRQAELCPRNIMMVNKNNSKRAYQLVKDLISEKHGRSSTIQASLGNILVKKKTFSIDGQNIAQNCTTMRVVETMQDCNAPGRRSAIDPP